MLHNKYVDSRRALVDSESRYRLRFFEQVGHDTGNKHFFTKSCHCQTYKIMNRANKNRAHFQKIKCFKNQNFKNIFLIKVGLLVQYSSKKKFLERFGQFSTLKNYYSFLWKLYSFLSFENVANSNSCYNISIFT